MAPFHDGEMSERLKEPVLKTGDAQASVGSNPTLSATSAESFEVCGGESDVQFNIQLISVCGSTQVAEGAPLLRE